MMEKNVIDLSTPFCDVMIIRPEKSGNRASPSGVDNQVDDFYRFHKLKNGVIRTMMKFLSKPVFSSTETVHGSGDSLQRNGWATSIHTTLATLLILAAMLLGPLPCEAQTSYEQFTLSIREQIASAVEIFTNPTNKQGTGIVFKLRSGEPHLFLVTNRHMLDSAKYVGFIVQIVDASKSFRRLDTSIVQLRDSSGKTKLIVPNLQIDIAAIPFTMPVLNQGEQIITAPETATAYARDLYVGEDVLFYGFPEGLKSNGCQPLTRRGMIAGTDTTQHMILLDAQVYNGSSGSPVFVFPRDPLKTTPTFIGIVAGFVNIERQQAIPVGKDTVNVVQSENSGIGYVMPASDIRQMLQINLGTPNAE